MDTAITKEMYKEMGIDVCNSGKSNEHQQQESDPGGKGGDEALKLLT